ncbi:hypothetical protein [Terrabacter sp. 2RAF25]|uniref:hypothetical protein n=1 Tax=Terrabacter sp. 2RAF25 TaxID=3232998 RepID=UPI003F9779C7
MSTPEPSPTAAHIPTPAGTGSLPGPPTVMSSTTAARATTETTRAKVLETTQLRRPSPTPAAAVASAPTTRITRRYAAVSGRVTSVATCRPARPHAPSAAACDQPERRTPGAEPADWVTRALVAC